LNIYNLAKQGKECVCATKNEESLKKAKKARKVGETKQN
jgi:hypothetical protein